MVLKLKIYEKICEKLKDWSVETPNLPYSKR